MLPFATFVFFIGILITYYSIKNNSSDARMFAISVFVVSFGFGFIDYLINF